MNRLPRIAALGGGIILWLAYGTINGDTVTGFIARDMDHRSIGRYFTVEAAMQAWAPVMDQE